MSDTSSEGSNDGNIDKDTIIFVRAWHSVEDVSINGCRRIRDLEDAAPLAISHPSLDFRLLLLDLNAPVLVPVPTPALEALPLLESESEAKLEAEPRPMPLPQPEPEPLPIPGQELLNFLWTYLVIFIIGLNSYINLMYSSNYCEPLRFLDSMYDFLLHEQNYT